MRALILVVAYTAPQQRGPIGGAVLAGHAPRALGLWSLHGDHGIRLPRRRSCLGANRFLSGLFAGWPAASAMASAGPGVAHRIHGCRHPRGLLCLLMGQAAVRRPCRVLVRRPDRCVPAVDVSLRRLRRRPAPAVCGSGVLVPAERVGLPGRLRQCIRNAHPPHRPGPGRRDRALGVVSLRGNDGRGG